MTVQPADQLYEIATFIGLHFFRALKKLPWIFVIISNHCVEAIRCIRALYNAMVLPNAWPADALFLIRSIIATGLAHRRIHGRCTDVKNAYSAIIIILGGAPLRIFGALGENTESRAPFTRRNI